MRKATTESKLGRHDIPKGRRVELMLSEMFQCLLKMISPQNRIKEQLGLRWAGVRKMP